MACIISTYQPLTLMNDFGFCWAYPSGPFYHLSPFCAWFFRPSLVNLWFELFQFLLRCMALRCEVFLNLQLDWNCASRSCCNFIVETVRLSTVTVSRTVSAIWRVQMLRSRGIRWQRRGRRRRRILIRRSPRISWTWRLTWHRRVFTWRLGLSRFLYHASTRCDAIFRYLLAMFLVDDFVDVIDHWSWSIHRISSSWIIMIMLTRNAHLPSQTHVLNLRAREETDKPGNRKQNMLRSWSFVSKGFALCFDRTKCN